MTRYSIPRADYTYTVDGNIIAITDLDLGSRSVTNDIENVLAEIRAELGDLAGYSVIYRDSLERWDRVQLVKGIVHLYSPNEKDPQMATRRLLHPITE